MFLILKQIGKVGKNDIDFLENEDAKKHIQNLEKKILNNQTSQFHRILQNKEIDLYLRNILKSLLHINPAKRMTASLAIASSYFDSIKNPFKELLPPSKFRLPIDEEEAFDYDAGVSHKYNK